MKPVTLMAAFATVAAVAVGMVACGKTSNSSNTATTPASACSVSWDGTMRDQYGRSCNNYPTGGANSCVGAVYNPVTRQYTNQMGQPVQCNPSGYFDGYNSIPYQGMYGGQQINGCQSWTPVIQQQYGQYAQYVPVDLGNGQLICMNAAYLQQRMPNYNWNQYAMYQQPVLACVSYDCYGGGYQYGGQSYGCSSSFNVGFNFGFGGASFGMCNPF
jgi:hypothetical protein